MKTLFSHKYNLEYYHTPKNGMTSIIKSLNLKWIEASSIPQNSYTFCVLRNPIERTVSSYLQIRNNYYKKDYQYTFRHLNKQLEIDIFFNKKISKGFLLYLEELNKNSFFESHNRPQNHYLSNLHRNNEKKNWIADRSIDKINYFLNFEKLNTEINNILTIHSVKLERINQSKSLDKYRLLKIAYANEKLIRKIYLEDIILYEQNFGKIIQPKCYSSYLIKFLFEKITALI